MEQRNNNESLLQGGNAEENAVSGHIPELVQMSREVPLPDVQQAVAEPSQDSNSAVLPTADTNKQQQEEIEGETEERVEIKRGSSETDKRNNFTMGQQNDDRLLLQVMESGVRCVPRNVSVPVQITRLVPVSGEEPPVGASNQVLETNELLPGEILVHAQGSEEVDEEDDDDENEAAIEAKLQRWGIELNRRINYTMRQRIEDEVLLRRGDAEVNAVSVNIPVPVQMTREVPGADGQQPIEGPQQDPGPSVPPPSDGPRQGQRRQLRNHGGRGGGQRYLGYLQEVPEHSVQPSSLGLGVLLLTGGPRQIPVPDEQAVDGPT